MSPDLIQYLNQRFDVSSRPPKASAAPFVTISRETGCHSFRIATLLHQRLESLMPVKWNIVTKEIIKSAMRELELDQQQVASILRAQERSHFTEIMKAFEHSSYKSDERVREILKEFIQNLARKGYVIIVGRAGSIVTNKIKSGLHLRLIAPLNWRIQSIMAKKNMNRIQARKYILESDEARMKLMQDFFKKQPASSHWDITVDNSRLSDEEIVEILITVLRKRNMI
ncbi:MAG: cytidylate kinase-like family protein [Bacteroidales bacterium]|nr:cytidylate kinase-like family protein [Bacteroidales bacterium]